MTGLHNLNLRKVVLVAAASVLCFVVTANMNAGKPLRNAKPFSQGQDSLPPKKDSAVNADSDTTKPRDSASLKQYVDTFSIKISKDTLEGPVNYEASDSAVLLVKQKVFLLYGKTKTTYKDVILNAPSVELNQETNILTAFSSHDSLGNVMTRARFKQKEQGFESDTIQFNFKSQKGLTKNTFTRQDQMFVQSNLLKKVDSNTTFARRVIMTTCDYDEPHFGFVANRAKFINNKVAVTGPIHPEFEGVPIPIYLPFGIFPLQNGRHSGLLPPQFVDNQQFGIGLEGLGYYHVLNEYFDVAVHGNVYSYGGWSANLTPSYRKRYRYTGSMNFSVQHTKFNFAGDPDYSAINTYFLTWSHTVDPKARPGTTFSASVNAGSTKYNQYVASNALRPFQNNLSSSISYSKTWPDKPFNFTMSANESQNSVNHLINLTLPDAGFTVTTIYPLQKKDQVGTPKWYEKVGIGYSGVARNQLSFYDTSRKSLGSLLDTLQWGAQHRIPISLSLPPVGPLIISPFISYEETWYTHEYGRKWDSAAQKVDTIINRRGFFTDRQASFGIAMNTSIYGTYLFKNSRLMAIRHTIRPNISFNYKPDLSARNYDFIQVDTFKNRQALAHFSGNIFSPYPSGRYGGITFGVDNSLEMKVHDKKDSTGQGTKVRLIDGFGFTSGYNFLQDSLKLQPFSLYFNSTLFKIVNITAHAILDPYQQNLQGQDINRFLFQGDRFRLARLSSGSVAISTSFQSKPRDATKTGTQTSTRQINDPVLLGDEQRLQDYMRRNPGEFVDFNIPYSGSLSFSLTFDQAIQPDYSYKTRLLSNVSFTNSFSLTPKWNFTTNGYFDFNTLKLTMFTMSISRDMHCWQMSINVTPIGQYRYFNITLSPKSQILQDLRVNRTKYYYNY